MAQSITLQTSDSDIVASDVLGRLSFAASSESSGSDAILIGASIYAMAESTFTEISNATSIIFATANSESAIARLKITNQGHLLPLSNSIYDIGDSSYSFRNLYSDAVTFGYIQIKENVTEFEIPINVYFDTDSDNEVHVAYKEFTIHNLTQLYTGSGLLGGGYLNDNLTIHVGQGDGISIGADNVSVDNTVVRTSGNQTISGVKNFTGSLTFNGTPVSISGHTHTSSDITNFNSAVSGLLPVKNILAGTGISISSVSGDYTVTSTGSGVLSDRAKSIVTTVFNNTGSSIPKMTAVYINGGQGDMPTIQKAIATGDATSAGTYGVTYEAIDNMSTGQVIVFGALTGLNTDQFNPTAPQGDVNGTVLYLSPTTSGALTTTKPSAPNHIVAIGTVVRTHQNEGVIEVRVQNGFELEELHNVAISGVTNGQFLQYNSASGLWLASSSGNFTILQLNGTGVSVSGHTHTSSDITNFNTAVSGLLPTISNSGNNRILTSTGSSVGINAESNLSFDGSLLNVIGTGNFKDLNVLGELIPESPYGEQIPGTIKTNKLVVQTYTAVGPGDGAAGSIDLYSVNSSSKITLKPVDFPTNMNGIFVFPDNGGGTISVEGHVHNSISSDSNNASISFDDNIIFFSGASIQDGGFKFNGLSLGTAALSNSGDFSLTGHTHAISDISTFTSSGLASRISDETGSGLLVFNNSPTLTGIPLAPTASSGTNTNQIASTAFVRTEISNLVASAPATLDTLNELATALGNDANFSTTVTNNLAGKANLSGATFTGTISAPSGNFTQTVNIASQTASTIAGFDASKNVTSLSTSTYPSLTELSYVKGVTSAIQTQLNGKSATGHTHTSSDITNFNSSVSGLLPTIANSGDNRVLTSTGSSVGVNAESNLTFNGSSLAVSGDIQVDNLKLDGNTLSSTFSDVNIISSGDIYLGPFGWGFGMTPKDIGCPVAAQKIYIAETLFLGETGDDPTLGIALNYNAGANNLTIYTHPNQGGGAVFSATGGAGVDMQGPVTIGPFGGNPANGIASLNITGDLIVSGSGLIPSNINNFDEAVDDRVSNLLVPGLGIDISYNDNANTLTISDNTTATVGAALYLWANFR